MRDRGIGKRCGAGRLIVIGLLLLIAGCAAGNDSGNSGSNRDRGFYGGVTGSYTGM
jgi:hypothetical protein